MEEQNHEFTLLLHKAKEGDEVAANDLWSLVYAELKKLARGRLRKAGPVTLSPTGLVHEIFLKLGPPAGFTANDRAHFTAITCQAMRYVLVEQVRQRGAQKRGVFLEPATVDDERDGVQNNAHDLLMLDEAVEKLASIDKRMARVVECRYFGGLTNEETAEALQVSSRTTERDWTKAKLLLFKFLHPDGKA